MRASIPSFARLASWFVTSRTQRAFAWIVTGAFAGHVFELMSLGRLRFENNVASPHEQDLTIVLSTDDAASGLVSVYVGTKTDVVGASPIELAGLDNGALYYVKAGTLTSELAPGSMPSSVAFTLVAVANQRDTTYATLRSRATTLGATLFSRPEDCAWDTRDRNIAYFTTTSWSRLYRLRFADITNPTAGGTLELLVSDGANNGAARRRRSRLDSPTGAPCRHAVV